MKRMRISPLLALCYPTWCLAIVFTILPAVLLVVPVAHAQHEYHAQGATITPPGGFGTIVFENSGAREAQEPFLRGIALLHSFEDAAAREAFRQAQQADPGFALAYWGEAMTYQSRFSSHGDSTKARQALDRLGRHAAGAGGKGHDPTRADVPHRGRNPLRQPPPPIRCGLPATATRAL